MTGPEPVGMPSAGALEVATLAGGCFWCTEAVFTEVAGVKRVDPGYTGGTVPNPTYADVCTGRTGHAEAVRVTFDPREVSYRDLLVIFLTTHDPTMRNRQGNELRNPVSFGHLLRLRRPEVDRRIGPRRDRESLRLAEEDRHRTRSVRRVLPGGGVPPRLLPTATR